MTVVRRVVGVAVLGTALLTSGCGVVAAAGIAAAGRPTVAPGPVARATASRGVDAADLQRRVRAAALAKRTVHVVGRSTGFSVTADVRYDASGHVAEHLTTTLRGLPAEAIVIGHRAWVRSPAFRLGNRWVTGVAGGTDPVSRSLQPMFDQLDSLDPMAQTARTLAGGLTRVGTAVIGGIPVTDYLAHPSVDDLLAAMPRAQADQLRTREITGIAVHLWVDHDFLLRRSTSTLTVSGQRVDTTLEMSHYGDPVSIAPPPPSMVVSAAQLVG